MSATKPTFGTMIDKTLSISSGIVGAWLFNEGSGTTVNDSSGNGLNGTFSGASPPTWTTDIYGSAISFSGTNAEISFSAPISGITTALSCLIAARRTADGNFLYMVCERANTSGGEAGWALMSNNDSLVIHCGTVGDEDSLQHLNTTPIQDLIFTINSADKAVLYSEGVDVFHPTITPAVLSSSANFRIAGSPNNTTQCFAGVISHVLVWNRILTSTEIATLTANPFAPYAPEPFIFFKMF